MEVFCDSQGIIHLTKNQGFHEKTKHIDVRRHFVRDVGSESKVIVKKIYTNDTPADMLTKPVVAIKFKRCLDLIRVAENMSGWEVCAIDVDAN